VPFFLVVESVILSDEPCVYPPKHEASVLSAFPYLFIVFCFLRNLGRRSRRTVKHIIHILPVALRGVVTLDCTVFGGVFFFSLVGKTTVEGAFFRVSTIHIYPSLPPPWGGAKPSTCSSSPVLPLLLPNPASPASTFLSPSFSSLYE